MHCKSLHPKALKDSIPYSQALCIKQICSKTSEVIKHLKNLKDAFIRRGYQSKILDHHFERAMNIDRKILLENKEKSSTQGNLLSVLTFNKTLPNIKNVIDKHWNILLYQRKFKKVFDKKPSIAYRRYISLCQLIEGNRIFKKTLNNQHNHDIAHHTSQDRTIFVVNK